MMSRFKKLLLLPSLLLTSSLTHGEAIAPENRDYFSTTMLSSVVGIDDIEECCLQYRHSTKAQWHDAGSAKHVTKQPHQEQAWGEEGKSCVEHSADWCDFKARVEGAKAEWYDKGSAEHVTKQPHQEQAWDKEEKNYEEHSADWYDFKARVEGAKAEWYDKGSAEYVTCKNNQSVYTKGAMIVRLKQAWDKEEQNYEKQSADWYDFKARVEGAKAEWFDADTPEYAICKNNQSVCTKNAMIIRRRIIQEKKHAEWDEEEKNYEEHSADWYDFKARIAGEEATWYDEGSAEYVTCKNNQSVCTKNAIIVRRRIIREKKRAEWAEEEKNYEEHSADWYDFKARIAGEEATWYDADTPEYTSLIVTQELYTAKACAERTRRQQEEALAEQRQQRISVGRRQLQDANNGAIRELIQLIFERAGLSQLYLTLTDDDLAEITFYIPDDTKNRLEGMHLNSFSYIYVSGHIVPGYWSTFADMIFAFYTFEDEAYFNYTSDTQPDAHIIASPEIEQFIESDLKSALKKLLDKSLDDVIEQNWASIYVRFDPFDLNRIRNSLTAPNIAKAYIRLTCNYDDLEILKAELLSNNWAAVRGLEVKLVFFDLDKATTEWGKIYDIDIDPDPRRPFDPDNPFTDREEGSVATILQGATERESIERLELIFSKERAKALYDAMMGIN